MAEIKVQIKGDDADFKRKMAESGEEAKAFGEKIKESLGEAKESAADLLKETGFGGITKVLTGGKVAALAFGAAIVEGLKSGIEKAIEFQKHIGGLRTALGPAQAGMAKDLAEWVEAHSGATGTLEENMGVMKKLLETKKIAPEEAKRDLLDIQNIAIKTGDSIESLGEAFAEMKTTGEIPKGFFRQHLAIAAETIGKLPGGVPGGGAGTPDEQEEALTARVQAAGGGAWMLRNVMPFIAPGGELAAGRIAAKGGIGGQIKEAQAEFEKALREMGEKLLPDVNQALRDLKEDIPFVAEELKSFGAGLHEVLQFLHPREAEHEALQSFFDKLNAITKLPFEDQITPANIWKTITESMPNWLAWSTDMKAAAAEHRAAAEDLHRMANPQ